MSTKSKSNEECIFEVTSFLSGSSSDKDPQWFQSVLGKFGFTGAIATILSFLLYFLYLKFVKKDSHVLSTFAKQIISWFISKIPGLNKIPFLNNFLSVPGVSKALIPKGTQSALASIKGTGGGVLSKLNPFNWNIFHKRRLAEEEDDEKYQAGEPYGDPKVLAPSLVDDLKAVGLKGGVKDLQTLLQAAKTKGKPANDREMLVSSPRSHGRYGTDNSTDGEDDCHCCIFTTQLQGPAEADRSYDRYVMAKPPAPTPKLLGQQIPV